MKSIKSHVSKNTINKTISKMPQRKQPPPPSKPKSFIPKQKESFVPYYNASREIDMRFA